MKDNDSIPGVNAEAEEGLLHVGHSEDPQAKDEQSNGTARRDIPELPQIRAESFACPVFVFKPKIGLEKARTLFTEKLIASDNKLPDGISIDSVLNSTSLVYVPSWLISGSAYGEWRATGIKAIDCETCDGTGMKKGGRKSPEHSENKEKQALKPCPDCHGTGKTDQPKDKGTAETGTAKAVVEEHVQSAFAGIEFGIDFDSDFFTTAKPVKASAAMVADLFCLQPDHDYKQAKELLTERLALALKNKAFCDLVQYDMVENLQFGATEVYLFNKVELWLHPYYISWYAKKDRKHFAICDGITGKVELPSQRGKWSLFRNLLVVATLGILITLGSGMFSHPKVASEANIPALPHYNRATDDTIFRQLLASIPAYEDTVMDGADNDKQDDSDMAANDKPVKSVHKNRTSKVAAAIKRLEYMETANDTASDPYPTINTAITANKENPAFDCAQVNIKAERLICSSRELSNEDRRMSEIFEQKKKSTFFEIFRKQMEFEQANWIENVRNACTDEDCLLTAYHKRMGVLSPTAQAKKAEICPIPGHCEASD